MCQRFKLFLAIASALTAAFCCCRWYAHGMNIIGIPLWLCPVHGLFVHWALDVYWLVTLTDARKATLP